MYWFNVAKDTSGLTLSTMHVNADNQMLQIDMMLRTTDVHTLYT